jgi:O-antigen/teichoic acid export membrane protein
LAILWLIVSPGLLAVTVLVRLFGRSDPAAAGHLLAGLMVARLPLFMFAAVQAALLPGLSALVALGRAAALRRRVAVLCLGIAGVMTVAVVVIGLVGPEAVRLLFGPSFLLSGRVLAALAAGTGLYMIAIVMANAVMAVGGFRAVAACWAGAVAGMLIVTALPGSLVTRVVTGFVVGAAAGCVALASAFRTSARTVESTSRSATSARADAAGGLT